MGDGRVVKAEVEQVMIWSVKHSLANALTGHDVTLINRLIAEAWEQIRSSM